MALLYLTSEQEIRKQALSDAQHQLSYQLGSSNNPPSVDTILERADKILAWYLRDAHTQEYTP